MAKRADSKLSALSSGPQAAVPKDPQPSVDHIDDLARRILKGDILLPKFQRDFVWSRPQIVKLWDSIARGYPIGSILLWQSRQELRSENQFADLEISLPKPDYPVNYLLDGQQRLSSICGAMYWSGTDEKSPWNIAFDLRKEEFVHLDILDDPPQHQIRLNKLADPAAFFKHVASLDNLTANDKQHLKTRADQFFNRFKNYKVASVTLGDMSIQDVAPIFERINSQGTSLTIVDLMRAATWSQDFDLIDGIKSIQDELEEKGFENIDRKVVLRSLSAATGGGFSADSISSQLRKHTPQELQIGVDDTREAYKRAVDFLATQIQIPNADVLPYSNQLVVLAETFRQIPKPTATQFQAITKWFWRTSHSEYFGGWDTGMMGRDLLAITSFANGTTDIEIDARQPSATTWLEKTFRLNNAHSKLLGIILGHCRPLDLLTGQRIEVKKALAWENSKEFHHFFPRDFLLKQGQSAGMINCLANFILLSSASNKAITNRAPSDYLKDVIASAGPNLQDWLDSNLIPKSAFDAAMNDDFVLFLRIRSQAIHERASALAKW